MTQYIWGEGPKIFISYTSSTKEIATKLKREFMDLGMSAFVAHEDIQVTEQWQEIILKALSSMDVFLPILSEGFKKSEFCDQELGFAVARRRLHQAIACSEAPVPIIIPFMFDETTPYGFISNEQAAKVNPVQDASKKVLETLLSKRFDLWFESFVGRVRKSPNFGHSNAILMPELEKIETISMEQARKLIAAVDGNRQASKAWDFMDSYLNLKVRIDDGYVRMRDILISPVGSASSYYDNSYDLPW